MSNDNNHHHHKFNLKHKIAISGAAVTEVCSEDALEKSKIIGREIAKHDIVLITGATTGIPYWAAIGAKEAGGFVLGYSPAASEAAHIKSYRLPIDYHDTILFTGFGYSGRNMFIIKSADAVITVCGRIGTLNEFTIAFEEQKVIGVLTHTGGLSDEFEKIVKTAKRGTGTIVYESDPVALIEKVVMMIEKEKAGEGIEMPSGHNSRHTG